MERVQPLGVAVWGAGGATETRLSAPADGAWGGMLAGDDAVCAGLRGDTETLLRWSGAQSVSRSAFGRVHRTTLIGCPSMPCPGEDINWPSYVPETTSPKKTMSYVEGQCGYLMWVP